MSTQINIQRISKQSGRLDASGLAVLGAADNKNNLSFVYNTSTNPYHAYVYSGDGVYIGQNQVSTTPRIFYSKDLASSKVYNESQYTAGKIHIPALSGTANDIGTLHIVMPTNSVTPIELDLNFRSLRDASTSFGDVNKVIKWGDYEDVSNWLNDVSTGALETHKEETNMTVIWTDASNNLHNKDVSVASTVNPSAASVMFDNSEKEGYGVTFTDEVYGKTTEEKTKLEKEYGNSLNDIAVLKSGVINFSDAWTKTLTNAYSGIISNIKWKGNMDKAAGGQLRPIRPLLEEPTPGPNLWGGPSDSSIHDDIGDLSYGGNIRQGASREVSSYSDLNSLYTYTVDDMVADNIAEVSSTEMPYQRVDREKDKASVEYVQSNNYQVYDFTNLFQIKEGKTNTAIGYTGPVAQVDGRVWDISTHSYDTSVLEASTYVYNSGDAVDITEYRPTNVWDEINYKFEVINNNFKVLTGDVAQTNIMIMEDTVGKLIPAIVSTTERNLNTISADVSVINSSLGWTEVSDASIFENHPTVLGYAENAFVTLKTDQTITGVKTFGDIIKGTGFDDTYNYIDLNYTNPLDEQGYYNCIGLIHPSDNGNAAETGVVISGRNPSSNNITSGKLYFETGGKYLPVIYNDVSTKAQLRFRASDVSLYGGHYLPIQLELCTSTNSKYENNLHQYIEDCGFPLIETWNPDAALEFADVYGYNEMLPFTYVYAPDKLLEDVSINILTNENIYDTIYEDFETLHTTLFTTNQLNNQNTWVPQHTKFWEFLYWYVMSTDEIVSSNGNLISKRTARLGYKHTIIDEINLMPSGNEDVDDMIIEFYFNKGFKRYRVEVNYHVSDINPQDINSAWQPPLDNLFSIIGWPSISVEMREYGVNSSPSYTPDVNFSIIDLDAE